MYLEKCGEQALARETALSSYSQARRETERESRLTPRVKDYIFAFCWQGDRRPVTECVTNDISAGGVCFDTRLALAAGSELWMEIYAPCDCRKKFLESLYAKVEVVWSAELESRSESNRFRVGARFTEIREGDRERLRGYVEDGFVDRRR